MDLQGFEDKNLFHRQQEQVLDSLAQVLPHLIWLADEKGHLFWWNQSWLEYTGRQESEMKNDGWFKVIHPHHLDRVTEGLSHAFQNGDIWEDTFPISNGRGQWKWFLSRAVPVREGRSIQYWVGTHTDISERRKVEEELRKSRDLAEAGLKTKNELLVNMSREIRIPMNTILGFASLLRDSNLSEEERIQFADKILSNGDQLLQIIDDILNLSKFDVGIQGLEKVRFNLCDMVYDVIQTIKPNAEKKDIKLNVFFNSAVPKLIESEPHRVRQILTNLFSNAIKYSNHNGRIMVFLEFLENTKWGPCIGIDVEDTGIGISREQQHKIFKPFAQLEGSFSRNSNGKGLGLALSEKLAESLGGNLSLKGSEIGEGSCFSLLIPTGDLRNIEFIKGKKGEPLTRKLLNSLKKTKRLENVRVLLAEDSQDNETLIRLYLEKEGASITYAHNGLEVLDEVKKDQFDIVLMDIQMPLLDGLEATRQLRQNGFSKPIVALTAHALEDDVEKSLKAGCDTHLTKPIRGEILIEEIQKRVFH
ncbi:MAG: response regulator [Pseudobdellovibrionaceae bacterium]